MAKDTPGRTWALLHTGMILAVWASLGPTGCGQEPGPAPAPTTEPAEPIEQPTAGYTYVPNDSSDSTSEQLTNRHENPAEVMELLALEEGMDVADVGAGGGFYSTRFAQAVGSRGSVAACDVKESLIRELDDRLRDDPSLDPHGVITTHVNALDDAGLANDSVDLLFMAHLDFYLYQPMLPGQVSMLESCYRAVRPGGRLVIVQWLAVPVAFYGPDGEPRAGSEGKLVANLRSAGFEKQDVHNLGPVPAEFVRKNPGQVNPTPTHYNTRFYEFRRPAEAAPTAPGQGPLGHSRPSPAQDPPR